MSGLVRSEGVRGHLIAALATLLVLALLVPARVAWAEGMGEPEVKEADAVALIDKGGNVLFEKNAEKREHPASITKVMTAMVALDAGVELGKTIEVTAPDLGENSQMGDYATGDKVTVDELMHVMLVYSGNDAAYNVACHVAGTEEAFVELMNKKAAEIGMEHTHFNNSHGLEDDDHYTCAIDIARMGKYALEHYPYIAQAALMHTVNASVYGEVLTLNSTDKLLDTFDGIRGIKTGAIIGNYTFLGASGRGNTQLYVAVLGCETFSGRFDDAASVMEWGYANMGSRTFTQGGWVVSEEPYAFDLGLRSVLATEGDFTGATWPGLKGFSYKTHQSRPGYLLDVGTTYGWTAWKQAGGDLGNAYYTTRGVPVRASSWNVFERPLFEDVSAYGEVASDG